MKKFQSGFTLIELLVVVLIIGILAAIALPQYEKAVAKTRYATLKNMTRSIADAQKMYYLANGYYASTFSDLGFYGSGTIDTNFDKKFQNFKWGQCALEHGDILSYAYAYCLHYTVNISYLIFLGSGAQVCVAYGTDTNAINHQICKSETGKSSTSGWYYYP